MPTFKRIGGGPWKYGQKSDDLTWNDPKDRVEGCVQEGHADCRTARGLTGKRQSTTIAATPDDGKIQRKRGRIWSMGNSWYYAEGACSLPLGIEPPYFRQRDAICWSLRSIRPIRSHNPVCTEFKS